MFAEGESSQSFAEVRRAESGQRAAMSTGDGPAHEPGVRGLGLPSHPDPGDLGGTESSSVKRATPPPTWACRPGVTDRGCHHHLPTGPFLQMSVGCMEPSVAPTLQGAHSHPDQQGSTSPGVLDKGIVTHAGSRRRNHWQAEARASCLTSPGSRCCFCSAGRWSLAQDTNSCPGCRGWGGCQG